MKQLIYILVLCSWLQVHGQQISGIWKQLPNRQVRLEGFNGFTTYPIAAVTTDSEGKFSLSYTAKDYGVGYLISDEGKPLFVILNGEHTEFIGETPANSTTSKVIKGIENRAFEQYATQQPQREQALSAWAYLEKLYRSDSLFRNKVIVQNSIADEQLRIRQEEANFLATLPTGSFARWFLPLRKLLSNVTTIAQYRTDEIPATLKALRNINYADERLYKSGLYKDAIDNHVWFIENSSGPLDSVFADINRSIDLILPQLAKDEKKYNEFANYLFDLLESRSLFESSEYLALKVLNERSCSLNTELANKLEGYRKLRKGNKAPDIVFGNKTVFGKHSPVGHLSEIDAAYKVVVFGAGWCDHCQQAFPKLAELYPEWKAKGVEVVFISLDETESEFLRFAGSFPFVAACDFKKWDSKAVIDYHVFGTPTYYVLDRNMEIILKPISVEQIDAWLNYSAAGK